MRERERERKRFSIRRPWFRNPFGWEKERDSHNSLNFPIRSLSLSRKFFVNLNSGGIVVFEALISRIFN